MPQSIAQVLVRGRGLLVAEATPAAEAIAKRPLTGIPLSETMCEPEYDGVLEVIRRTIETGRSLSTVCRAPNGSVGRVTADAALGGALVSFRPIHFAMQELHGRDLVMGWHNDLFGFAVDRPTVGIAAREAFPEERWAAAQDKLAYTMRTGLRSSCALDGGRLWIARVASRLVRTAWGRDPSHR